MRSPELQTGKCVPCRAGESPLAAGEIDALRPQVPGWQITEQPRITKTFQFHDFKEAMIFVNRMAEVAEAQGHHPDFFVHWNEVRVEMWTHATGGLHRNDFIMAAKIDGLE